MTTCFPLSSPYLLLLLFLILCPFNSIAAGPNTHTLFQVTKPIDVDPNTVPCKQLLLQHEFSSADGKPQVATNYDGPPSNCGPHRHGFSKIVLESRGTFRGTQDDAVFGVWLGGVELLRSSPAQGTNTSVAWEARKDITRYSSLLLKKEKQKLVVYFRTTNFDIGVYHIALSISFYPLEQNSSAVGHNPDDNSGFKSDSSKADLILPISRNLESKDGLWFQIENSTDEKVVGFKIPRNAYRAVLEVYVSSHRHDQLWYSNYLPQFYNSNQFWIPFGNGPFRDAVIALDHVVAGAIWPYPALIYAQDFEMWNPVASIRCFDFPSYDIELTPFLGTLLDGGIHNLSFSIGNALNVWYINANLHLWIDHKSSWTEGKLVSNYSQPLDLSSTLEMKGKLGKSWVEAHRIVTSQGWVQSSHGNITTHVNQNLSYTNYMDTNLNVDYSLTTEQLILSNYSVSFVTNRSDASDDQYYFNSFDLMKNFSQMTKTEIIEMEGDGFGQVNVQIGYSDEKTTHENSDQYSKSTRVTADVVKDQQSGHRFWLIKNHTWLDALEGMNQSYHYQKVDDTNDIKVCYFRNISTLNASIVYDQENIICAK